MKKEDKSNKIFPIIVFTSMFFLIFGGLYLVATWYDNGCFTNIAEDYCEEQNMTLDYGKSVYPKEFFCKGNFTREKGYEIKSFKYTEEEINKCTNKLWE